MCGTNRKPLQSTFDIDQKQRDPGESEQSSGFFTLFFSNSSVFSLAHQESAPFTRSRGAKKDAIEITAFEKQNKVRKIEVRL